MGKGLKYYGFRGKRLKYYRLFLWLTLWLSIQFNLLLFKKNIKNIWGVRYPLNPPMPNPNETLTPN